MVYVSTGESTATYTDSNGVLRNTVGYLPLDVVLPFIGGSKADLIGVVESQGKVLIEEGSTGFNTTKSIELNPGELFIFYVIPDNSKPLSNENLWFSEDVLNVSGIEYNLDFFSYTPETKTVGIEDLPRKDYTDLDFDDTVFTVNNVESVDYVFNI